MTDSVTEAIRRTQEAIERDGVNMSDLVERLKRVQNPDYPECQQAADEIGRLQDAKRAALKLANEHAMKVNELRQHLVKIKTAMESAHTLLISASVASCTCLTKTPEALWHAADCRYGKIQSALECVEVALSDD